MSKLSSRLPLVVAAVILIFIGIGAARRCSEDGRSSLAEKLVHPGDDTLAVAIEMSPLTYTFANDTADGFDYQIIKAITSEHGVAAEFFPVANLEEAYTGLKEGKYDIVVANMPATAKLREYFPLTEAVYLDRQVLVQRRNDSTGVGEVGSALDLRDDTVFIPTGSPVRSRIENMSREMGDTVFIETLPGHNAEHLAIMTATGGIPRAVVAEAVARRVAADYPQLDYSTAVSFNQFQVWATAPGDTTLRDSLNSWLSTFSNSDAYRVLAKRYLE